MKKIILALALFTGYSLNLNAQCAGFDMSFITNDPTCFMFSDASLTVTTVAGNGGNIYTITNVSDTQLNLGNSNTVNNLGTGWYYCHIIDNMGCEILDSVFIDQPGELTIDFYSGDALCFGDSSGFAVVDTVNNFAGDYNNIAYFWNPNPSGSNGIGQDSCLQLSAGDYTVTINDENGCSKVFDFEIFDAPELYFVELGVTHNTTIDNGVVFCSAGGGTPDYSYLWTNLQTNVTTVNTTWGGLTVGQYQIEVTDDNGCVLTAIVELGYLAVQDNTQTQLEVYPTLIQQGIVQVDNKVNETIRFVIYNSQGQKVYDELMASGKTTVSLNLENGSYFYQTLENNSAAKILKEGKLVVAK